jgi:hypothetical protein
MSIGALIALALSIAGKGPAPAKKNVIIGPKMKMIDDFLKLAPDIDLAVTNKKEVATKEALCAFLATTTYEKVFALYHGYSTGLTIDEAKGIAPTFDEIFALLQTMVVTSQIKQVELLSCLGGNNAAPLFKIAKHLKTKLYAATFLRARNNKKFSAMNPTILSALDVFRNYFVLGKDPDVKTYLQKHANELVYQYFSPISFEKFGTTIESVDFVHITRDEALDKLSDVQNSRHRSFVDAQQMTISDEATALARQTDFLTPQFELFAWIEFAGG